MFAVTNKFWSKGTNIANMKAVPRIMSKETNKVKHADRQRQVSKQMDEQAEKYFADQSWGHKQVIVQKSANTAYIIPLKSIIHDMFKPLATLTECFLATSF